jgi:hypothetical protein
MTIAYYLHHLFLQFDKKSGLKNKTNVYKLKVGLKLKYNMKI